jgi:flagellar basal body rod protein FlgF
MVAMISLSRQFDMQMQMITNAQANDRSAGQVLQNF